MPGQKSPGWRIVAAARETWLQIVAAPVRAVPCELNWFAAGILLTPLLKLVEAVVFVCAYSRLDLNRMMFRRILVDYKFRVWFTTS